MMACETFPESLLSLITLNNCLWQSSESTDISRPNLNFQVEESQLQSMFEDDQTEKLASEVIEHLECMKPPSCSRPSVD